MIIKETINGFELKIRFNKWKKTLIPLVFFFICLITVIKGAFFPFIIPLIILLHVILVMIFGSWQIKRDNDILSIRTGFAYLYWIIEINISDIKDIEQSNSTGFNTYEGNLEDIKIHASKINTKTCQLLKFLRFKSKIKPENCKEIGFGASMPRKTKQEVLTLLYDQI